jgi:hypothetical protein
VGVRRRTDKGDYIAEIMELKGGETQGIFRLGKLRIKNRLTDPDAQWGMFICNLINRRRRRRIK